ncbi:MAG: phosphoribosylformylglycinamidine cyclo-ligase [Deltaproteobacteria bacterium]|jgi:phosphoribosylformylglycinamidine cyclo-ligase|nr:phosphoribosylformylglycinamidine cyclo-ligase [Deltaproteobacteria bacterium]
MSETKDPATYQGSGVSIDLGNEAVRLIRPLAESTYDSRVLTEIGGFSGLYGLGSMGMDDPILVAATDGVGTKLKVAFLSGRHDTVGIDLVAMSVNDVLVQGARPLFFLDYISISKLVPEIVRDIVKGVATGCRKAGCALLGGETAEMPGFYADGEYDLAGFAVGVVEREKVIDGSMVAYGNQLLAISSSGLHSNGYSLAREVIFGRLGLDCGSPLLGSTVADVLLEPTKIYVRPVMAALKRHEIHAMAHVTGGGLTENLPRVLPNGCRAVIRKGSWETPGIFGFLRQEGNIAEEEMYRVFNMGIGFVLVVAEAEVDPILTTLGEHGEHAFVIGHVEKQTDSDRLVFV